MRKLVAVTLVGILAGACTHTRQRDEAEAVQARHAPKTPKEARAEATPAAEDTARNAADHKGDTLTATDQSNEPADLEITAAIRRDIVGREGFSMNARNVKIITRDGVVTLRGPVDTITERDEIAALARRTEGVVRVDDQLAILGH